MASSSISPSISPSTSLSASISSSGSASPSASPSQGLGNLGPRKKVGLFREKDTSKPLATRVPEILDKEDMVDGLYNPILDKMDER